MNKRPYRRLTRAEARQSFEMHHPNMKITPVKVRAKRTTKPKVGETPYSASLRKSLDKLYGVLRIRLFRNNTGMLRNKNGKPVFYGLCVGSSDNIGWKSIVITPDMVGKRVAVFTAVEAKTDSDEAKGNQNDFLCAVQDAGGIALVANAANGEQLVIDRIRDWKPGVVYQVFPASVLPSEELPF